MMSWKDDDFLTKLSMCNQNMSTIQLQQYELPSVQSLTDFVEIMLSGRSATSDLLRATSWKYFDLLMKVNKKHIIKICEIRLSTAPRRRPSDVLDLDIVRIGLPKHFQKKGIATTLFYLLVQAGKRLIVKRGVFVEQAITTESKNWVRKLIKQGAAFKQTLYGCDDDYAISVLSIM